MPRLSKRTAEAAILWIILLALYPLATAADGTRLSVRATPLEQLLMPSEISAPATVVSLGDSRLSAEINALIAELPVRVGEIVEPGGVLARLDCGDYQLAMIELEAMVKGTEARLVFARAQLQRVRSLKAKQTVSQEVLDQRESELADLVAELNRRNAQLGMARRKIDKCQLKAPFRAAVVERLASVGEYATPGKILLRVLDVSNLEVSAHVIAGDAASLEGASRILFRQGGMDYPVTVRALAPLIDPLTRTRELRLLFQGDTALPGATGRLVWSNGPMLPADFLVRRGSTLGVLIADGNKARFHPVPGAREGRPAPVNLAPEALIITDGRFALESGDAIRLLN